LQDRIQAELTLLRQDYPDVEYQPEGHWVLVPSYPLPEGWNRTVTDIVFLIPDGYPGTPPYGFYVHSGLLFGSKLPGSYSDTAPEQPPFGGPWGFFSWHASNGWFPSADIPRGNNLLQWANGFSERFAEGG
jgi:hypothetical protein